MQAQGDKKAVFEKPLLSGEPVTMIGRSSRQ